MRIETHRWQSFRVGVFHGLFGRSYGRRAFYRVKIRRRKAGIAHGNPARAMVARGAWIGRVLAAATDAQAAVGTDIWLGHREAARAG
jgi:hypothetical protein